MNQKLLAIAAQSLWKVCVESGAYQKVFTAKEIADCVIFHAAAAGASAMAIGVLPGAGAAIAFAISTGAIWRMYIKICQIIGFSFGKNKLKTISSAVISNLTANLASILAIELATSFIPIANIISIGVCTFFIVYLAGLVFLNTLTKLFKVKRTDYQDWSDNEWKESMKVAMAGIDQKAVLQEAKKTFTEMRKDGSLDKAKQTVDISMEDDE